MIGWDCFLRKWEEREAEFIFFLRKKKLII